MSRKFYGGNGTTGGNEKAVTSSKRVLVSAAGVSGPATERSFHPGLFGNPFAAVVLLIGTISLLFGCIWLGIQQFHRFPASVGKPKLAYVEVSGVKQQTDEEHFENAVAQIDRYHLTSVYSDDTGSHDVVLEEGYIDKEQAESMIGGKRLIRFDTATYAQIHDNGFNMLFAAPLAFGLTVYIILGLVYIKKERE